MIDLSRTRMNLSYNVRRIGTTDLGPIHRALDIVCQADYVFVNAGFNGIHVLDVADPRRPQVIGNWGWWEEGWLPARMKIVEDRAYVIGQAPGLPPALRILNISRPAHPREIGCCVGDGIPGNEPFHWDIAIAGTLAYVAFGGQVLWVLDISDPSAPEEVCDIQLATRVSAVEVREDLAYVVAGGLQVMDIRDPMDPAVVGRCEATWIPKPYPPVSTPIEEPTCRQLAVDGNRAFVADNMGGYRVIDLSKPTRPAKIGWIQTPDDVRDVDIGISGNFAFILDLGRRGHLRVFDISQPADPISTGFRDIPTPSHCLGLSGEHAYVAGFTHFGIYDCSAALPKPNES